MQRPREVTTMTPKEYWAILDELGYSQLGLGRLFGLDRTTVWRRSDQPIVSSRSKRAGQSPFVEILSLLPLGDSIPA